MLQDLNPNQRWTTDFSILLYPQVVIVWKEKVAFDLSKISAVKFSIPYYLSLVISWKEKLAFDPSKISAVKFSILYYLSLVISWKEKFVFGHFWGWKFENFIMSPFSLKSLTYCKDNNCWYYMNKVKLHYTKLVATTQYSCVTCNAPHFSIGFVKSKMWQCPELLLGRWLQKSVMLCCEHWLVLLVSHQCLGLIH